MQGQGSEIEQNFPKVRFSLCTPTCSSSRETPCGAPFSTSCCSLDSRVLCLLGDTLLSTAYLVSAAHTLRLHDLVCTLRTSVWGSRCICVYEFDKTQTCSDQSLNGDTGITGDSARPWVNGKSSIFRIKSLKESTTSAVHHSAALNRPPDFFESYSGG